VRSGGYRFRSRCSTVGGFIAGREFAVSNSVDAGFAVEGILTSVITTDVNGDGLPDVIASTRAEEFPGGVSVSLNQLDDGRFLLGDVNLDGVISLLDVAPFVDLILAGKFQLEADINMDGIVDLLDVAPFVNLLVNG